jgi:hypothetical protein
MRNAPTASSGRLVAACAATMFLAAALVAATAAWAQPAPGARGCCCLAQGGSQGSSYVCGEKTQADCLALQPAAPTFPKLADWKKAWNDMVAASKAQEAKPLQGGWIAESCEKAEARIGCCCFPPSPTGGRGQNDCKPGLSEFDCRAECALLRDGRQPSGCTWTVGACRP